ncbi:hypothetical protein HY380_02270 [Candidatus Saccharibacteria bacterium]|nr:hypothetical protein [Candidatus Saccharibacteria bacterium]
MNFDHVQQSFKARARAAADRKIGGWLDRAGFTADSATLTGMAITLMGCYIWTQQSELSAAFWLGWRIFFRGPP